MTASLGGTECEEETAEGSAGAGGTGSSGSWNLWSWALDFMSSDTLVLLEDQNMSLSLPRRRDPQNLGKESQEQEIEGYLSMS
jgi:hypothetical protein